MRYVVIAMLVLIVASMGSALYYLMTERTGSRRMLRSLALRVGLSVALFAALMAGYWLGLIPGRL